MFGIVVDGLMSSLRFGGGQIVPAGVQVSRIHRKEAGSNLHADAMAFEKYIGDVPQINTVLINFAWSKQRELLIGLGIGWQLAISGAYDLIQQPLRIAIRVDIHQPDDPIRIRSRGRSP